jgi:hypothetical protein
MPKERPILEPLVSYLYHANNPAPEPPRNGKNMANHEPVQDYIVAIGVCRRLQGSNPSDTPDSQTPETFRRTGLNYRVRRENKNSEVLFLLEFSLELQVKAKEQQRKENRENKKRTIESQREKTSPRVRSRSSYDP